MKIGSPLLALLLNHVVGVSLDAPPNQIGYSATECRRAGTKGNPVDERNPRGNESAV